MQPGGNAGPQVSVRRDEAVAIEDAVRAGGPVPGRACYPRDSHCDLAIRICDTAAILSVIIETVLRPRRGGQ